MGNKPVKTEVSYQLLINTISETYVTGRKNALAAVNTTIVETYWKIGQYIVEFEQGGEVKAEYGKALLENLSRDLSRIHGKGFSRSNLNYMRLFYQRYPICETVSHKLHWSHICELVKIDDPIERSFYEKQTIIQNWNIRELRRQKNSSLFLRLAASRDKEGILQLAKQGQIISHPADLTREPYIFEFLKIQEKDDLMIKYAMHNNLSQLFVNKYQLYLPNKEELHQVIESQLRKNLP